MSGVSRRIGFGPFILDEDTRELRHGTDPVHLTRKAFELLTFLLEERPRVVSKAALQDRLWPKTFVSDANLPILIAEIRGALGDTARQPTFIRTVHGVGYAFCGAASIAESSVPVAPPASSSCWLVSKTRHAALHDGENVIGRDPAGDVWLDGRGVSRRHARILVQGTAATLEDLGSKNGTWIGKERLAAKRVLADGDQIRFGAVIVTFRLSSVGDTTDSVGSM